MNTTLPVTTVQCAEFEQGDMASSFTIANTTYNLPRPVPILYDEEIVGQITTDGRHLIFSFQSFDPATVSTNGHCVVSLHARKGELVISGDPERGDFVVSLTDKPWEWDTEERQAKLNSLEELPMSEFGRIWLHSADWSALPTPYALYMLLGSDNPLDHPLVVDHSSDVEEGHVEIGTTAEYMTLSLLANSISFGFANESVIPPPNMGTVAPMVEREVHVRKVWYAYVQSGVWPRFWAFVLMSNSFIVLWSLVQMLRRRTSSVPL